MKKIVAFLVMLVMAFTLAACDGEVEENLVDITLESDVSEANLTQDPAEVTEGMEVTVTASEVDGYAFSAWVDSEGSEVSTERTYTFTAEDAITIEAVYDEVNSGNGDTYSLNISSGLETASWTVSEDGPYDPGDEVTIEASEVDTYSFLHWIDSDSETVLSEERSFTFTVDEDSNIEAVYEDTLNTDERTAQTVVDETTENTAYLDTLMSDYTVEEGMSMSMHMALDMDDPESSEAVVYDMQIAMSTVTLEGNRVSKLQVSLDMPDMPETMNMSMYMEESETETTYYVNTEMILDMLMTQENIDLRTLLDMQSDYVHYTIPKDITGTDQEVVYDEIMNAIYEEFIGPDYQEGDVPELDPATLDALFENMGDMMAFMSFAHLSSYEDVTLTMDRNGTVAEGQLSMGGDALEALAKDLFEEVYKTLELLDENDAMTPYSEIITTQDYNMAMGMIGMIPQMNVNMEYDAANEQMHIDMDVYTLLNFFMEDSPEFENVNDITMEMTMDKGVTIDDLPSNSNNLETMGEEFIQIMTVVESVNYLSSVAQDTEITPGTYTLSDLEGMNHRFTIPFIDKDLSKVAIDDSGETPVYSIELYYQHDGDAVFEDTSLTLGELGAVMDTEPTTRQDVLDILALVSDTNFELYSVLSDIIEQMLEDAVSVEPSMPLPESDVANATEPGFFSRYMDSVLIDHQVDGSSEMFAYAVDATALDVRDFYSNHYTSDVDWTVQSEQEMEGSYSLTYYNASLEYGLSINISPESAYDSGIMYYVSINDLSSSS